MSKRVSSNPRLDRELTGRFRLAHASRAGEQVAADRLLRIAQASASELDGRGQRGHRLILAVDSPLQGRFEVLEHLGVVLRHRLRRDSRHRRDGRLDLLDPDRLLALRLRQQHLRGARLVDHVDRLIGQLAVMDVARGQFHGRLHRLSGVAQFVELLEIGLEPLEDLDRVGDARLLHVDLLEPADQRPVLLKILSIFLVSR